MGGSTSFEGLQDVEARPGQSGRRGNMARIGGQGRLHPMGHVLGYAAHNGQRGMHMGVNQAGKQGAIGGLNDFLGLETGRQLGRGANGDDPAPAHRHRSIRDIADPLAAHGEEVGVG